MECYLKYQCLLQQVTLEKCILYVNKLYSPDGISLLNVDLGLIFTYKLSAASKRVASSQGTIVQIILSGTSVEIALIEIKRDIYIFMI